MNRVADGLKVRIDENGDAMIQNMSYNKWTYSHYFVNMSVVTPSRNIIARVFNVPWAFHNLARAKWGGIESKLESIFKKMEANV